MTHCRHQPGFTVIEMLVAISVTVLLMTMIFHLFQNTQRAVSTGIKLGEMMVESETIGNQIHRDAEAMLPPSGDDEAGFLVIVQRELVAEGNEDDEGFRLRLPGGWEVPEYDPDDPDNDEDDRNRRPIHVRSDQLIFVRERAENRDLHAITPEHDGTLASGITADHARVWYGHMMRTELDGVHDVDVTLEVGEQPNRFINTWVLGRQALLLAEGVASPTIHALSAEWDAEIEPSSYGPVDPPRLFHGLTDVANQELESLIDEIEQDDIDYGYVGVDGGGDPIGVYPFALSQNRPWVNPDPGTAYFEPWRIAQMHTYLSGKVSDIIIDFAGDYDDAATGNEHPANEGQINRDDDGNIIWYSHFHDEPGPVTHEPPGDSFENDGTADENHAYYITDNLPDEYEDIADAVFVFRHDDADSDDTKWPYLIRIRYRMHSLLGDVGGTRYTPDLEHPGIIHDDAWDDGPTPGRWFEHVIQVQRPD